MTLQSAKTLPLVDLRRQYESIKDEVRLAMDEVLNNSDFIMGEAVFEFEREFAAFCGVKHAIGVASGTAALHLVLYALGVGAGDEVITVAHTFIATAEPIVILGARPVFVDINLQDYTLDPARLERAITPRTRAIIPVHLYGQCADMSPILEIAEQHGIPVIEDAAQAHGATYDHQRAGSMGIAGCFSFYPGKNLGAYGDAGAITTNDDALAERLRRLRNHGRQSKYEHLENGYGERLDTLQAAVLRVKLQHLTAWNSKRQNLAVYYSDKLSGIPELKLPHIRQTSAPVFHLYVIRLAERDLLLKHLQERGIQAGIHYPIPLHLQPAYRALGYHRGDLPQTETAASSVLSLPLFPEMTRAEQDFVIAAIRDFYG